MVDKSKVACFSGHRRLPQDCEELRAKLKKEIIGLIERGGTAYTVDYARKRGLHIIQL